MPEYHKCLAHYLLFLFFFQYLCQICASLRLLGLLADLTNEEAKQTRTGLDGLVQRLGPTCNFQRGCNSGQPDFYPAMFRSTARNPNPPSIQNLELNTLAGPSSSILLSYLTHTSIQIYKLSLWETSVMKVPKKVQKFKVGLALEFEDYIIAFISNDLMFQRAVSPSSKQPGLACEIIQSTQDVWCGIGVYTICEVFFDAGVSPLEAEYAFLYFYDNLAKETQDQIDKLASCESNWYRSGEGGKSELYDAKYVHLAFDKKALNLGHLIFGPDRWKALGGSNSNTVLDLLSNMFSK
ncbi:hypothetical protein M413DRAFT_30608 [Hebeloma cylindrosporum]|uniref:Uncharacterized protein n=1 Tax=Hebeloma cylindrosporum TaxID=76867 RepID=A0A0C2YAA8_HEBCY|nr:hypothetical protein M413DRAFT_30608 [Hebeloma cylindrosporum h7]